MSKYFVRTIEIEPTVSSIIEKELIDNLPIDETIENRFPFDDIERNKMEIYKQGTAIECQDYINNMDERIRHLFKVDCCVE
ncbi:hypothetical protein CVO_06070 [Sulfurimonas sp. CVO]|uniref:hypothetical protein n=1 Tax=Sulfurimonas sp. CVO TaxID=2283483 RepID=UPI00132E9FC2|nr:hypothetical protein [Sulfurimonas sp. CVO]QHG91425.1 hypothetical protein CVO_06070 [Sulfurimonas sp. CVO]